MTSMIQSACARRFADRTALVVGAGSGAGRAVAMRLGLEGAKVAIAARSAPHVEEGERVLAARGVTVRSIRGDASTAEGAQAVVESAISAFGGIDVLVVTAGGYEGGSIEQCDAASLDRMLALNLKVAFHAVKSALPHLVARGGGSIVITTAIFGGTVPGPGLLAYNTSKAAAQGFAQSLAGDLQERNVRVNAVLPGGIAHQFDPERDVAAGRRLGKGPAQPEDVAAAVAFLASDEACFITGAALAVDGGFACARKAF
jgi:3-oxoacyl-[acyl-carrier protein] reductase